MKENDVGRDNKNDLRNAKQTFRHIDTLVSRANVNVRIDKTQIRFLIKTVAEAR